MISVKRDNGEQLGEGECVCLGSAGLSFLEAKQERHLRVMFKRK